MDNKKKINIVITVIAAFLLLGGVSISAAQVIRQRQKAKEIEFGFLEPEEDLVLEEGFISIEDENHHRENPLLGRNIYFSGIVDSIVGEETVVYLENLKENGDDIFIKYEVFDGDKLVYNTDLTPSGKAAEWMIGDSLSCGEYDLMFCQTPYWKNKTGSYVQLTGGTNTVHFSMID